MSGHFKQALIDLSVGDDWFTARDEWETEKTDHEADNCICGVPIMERFHIINKLNNNRAIVGNVCIKRIGDAEFEERITHSARHCLSCGTEKPLSVREQYCKSCRVLCACGVGRKAKNAHFCNECKHCARCLTARPRERWGTPPTMCRDCVRRDYLANLPPCTACGGSKTSDEAHCLACRTPIGFSKYKNLTPYELFLRDKNYANWICAKTQRTDLVNTLKRIAQHSLKK